MPKDKTNFTGRFPKAYWTDAPLVNAFTKSTQTPQQFLKKTFGEAQFPKSKSDVQVYCEAMHPYNNNLFLTNDILTHGSYWTGVVGNSPEIFGITSGLISTGLSSISHWGFNSKVEEHRQEVYDDRMKCSIKTMEYFNIKNQQTSVNPQKALKHILKNEQHNFKDSLKVKNLAKKVNLSEEDKTFIYKTVNKSIEKLTQETKDIQANQADIFSSLNQIDKHLKNQDKRLDGIDKQLKNHENKLDNIEKNVNVLVKAHKDEQDEKEKQATFQNNLRICENTLAIASFIIGQSDPKAAAIVNTIGGCAMGIAVAAMTPPPGIGTVVGVVAAALPMLGLFGGSGEDIDQKRHEEIMEALATISEQISELGKQMHERFDLVHEHLQELDKNIGKQFNLTLFYLNRIDNALKEIVSDIQTNQKLTEITFKEVKGTIEYGQDILKDIWRQYLKIEYKSEITLLKSNLGFDNINHTNIEKAFKEIHKYAYFVGESGVFNSNFKKIINYKNANALQKEDINYFIGFANLLGTDIENIPNFYVLSEGVNSLIYFDALFHGRYDTQKNAYYLQDLLEKSIKSKEVLQKIATIDFIEKYYKDYKEKSDKLLKIIYDELKSIEREGFRGITSIPTTYHLDGLAYIEMPVFITVHNGSELNDWRLFNEKIEVNNQSKYYYPKSENNVFNILRNLEYLTLLNLEEIKGDKKKETEFAEKEKLFKVNLVAKDLFDTNMEFFVTSETYKSDYLDGVYACSHIGELFNGLKKGIAKEDEIFKIIHDIATNHSLQENISNKTKTKGEELNLIEFLYAKLNKEFEKAKKTISKRLEKKLKLGNNYQKAIKEFEKASIAFLFFSTINRICTDYESIRTKGYRVSYLNDIFTKEDLLFFVNKFSVENYLQTKNYWKETINLRLDEQDITLNGSNLIDVIFLRLYKQLHVSAWQRMDNLNEIALDSVPPILANTIRKLEWYIGLPDE